MATFRVPWPFFHPESLPFLLTVLLDLAYPLPLCCWYLLSLLELMLLWSMWQRLLQSRSTLLCLSLAL